MLDALCHLHRPPLWDDRARALAEGRRHGVRRVLVAATDRASWSRVLQCRDAGPVALGVHPWWQDDPAELEAVARSEGVEYIGEIGLDGLRRDEQQLPRFRAQLEVAARLELPVVLHCVRAWHQLLPEVRRFGVRGHVHGFRGGPELARQILAEGLDISVGRAVLKPSRKLVEALKVIPSERLRFESDAPDQFATPAGAAVVRDEVARLLGQSRQS